MNKELRSGLLLVGALAMIGAVAVTAWRVAYAPQASVVAIPEPARTNTDVLPLPVETQIPDTDVADPAPVAAADACFVAGCSNQVCTDDPEIMTTCEWQEEYSCYASATCERQATGECGWTPTPELSACLMSAQTTPEPMMLEVEPIMVAE